MSASSRKGYDGEKPVLDLLNGHDNPEPLYYRPRAGGVNDVGDIAPLPYVISVKNYRADRLGAFVDALPRLCVAADLPAGVVWHKRIGKGNPRDWFVTTSGEMWLEFHDAYLERGPSG